MLMCGPLLIDGAVLRATPQQGSGEAGMHYPNVGMGEHREVDATRERMEEQQAKARNLDRQKRLVDDTAKLYALAGELKEEVAKTDQDKLSLDVIKKADEIERLAHSVKEKMKG